MRSAPPYPLTLRFFGPDGELLLEQECWTPGQLDDVPDEVIYRAAEAHSFDALGRTVSRTRFGYERSDLCL